MNLSQTWMNGWLTDEKRRVDGPKIALSSDPEQSEGSSRKLLVLRLREYLGDWSISGRRTVPLWMGHSLTPAQCSIQRTG